MLYRILLFVHVLAAIGWFGAGILFQLMSERVMKLGDATRMREFIRTGSLVPPAFFGVLTAVVLGSGIWLVLETGYDFKDPFVVVGIAGIVASGAIGGAVIGRTTEALRPVVEAPTLDEGTLRAGVLKLRNAGRLDVLIMTAVVFMMTAKLGN